MQKNISPEEKLLSLIKARHGRPDDNVQPKPEIKDKKAEMIFRIFDPEYLRFFNKYMVIIGSIFILYLIFDMIFTRPSRQAAVVISKASGYRTSLAAREKEMPVETKNYSYYSNKISGKNIFAGSSYQPEAGEGQDAAGEDLSGAFGLVGIVPGDNPQAIIEDKKNNKTYYLTKGQSINDIIVDEITENKVTLDYRGKKITLFL